MYLRPTGNSAQPMQYMYTQVSSWGVEFSSTAFKTMLIWWRHCVLVQLYGMLDNVWAVTTLCNSIVIITYMCTLQLGTCDSPLYLAELAERVQGQCLNLKGPSRQVTEPGMRPKLLQFRENHRPAYWGTWRKKSGEVRPRNPFGQDKVCHVNSNDQHV